MSMSCAARNVSTRQLHTAPRARGARDLASKTPGPAPPAPERDSDTIWRKFLHTLAATMLANLLMDLGDRAAGFRIPSSG